MASQRPSKRFDETGLLPAGSCPEFEPEDRVALLIFLAFGDFESAPVLLEKMDLPR